ncbi:MAG: ParB/RepB/Spo0J family partition protein [Acidobacteria bacterium]|nr:ParB/RepB/Spo0J family partition protein [Acidobacteriota bacterium]
MWRLQEGAVARMGFGIYPEEDDPPAGVIELADRIDSDGGHALALYREPVGNHWQIFALLPLERVQPTPYQRDLSKTHAERLLKVIKKLDRFVDPVVAVRAEGAYWIPNGNHRRYALEKLKAKFVPAIVIPETDLAFQILALNTEKAHNLKEKSLEVIRMYRGLLEGNSTKEEESYAFQFEEPYYITLGLLYEKNARFAGGAYSPILRRVDKFLKARLKSAYSTREERAGQVAEADVALKKIVDALKRRGLNHPFVKNFVLARCNPLTRARKSVPGFEQAIGRLIKSLQSFDVQKIRQEDIARSSVMATRSS